MPPKGLGPKRDTIEWKQVTVLQEGKYPNQPKVKCARESCGREFWATSTRLIEHICGIKGNVTPCLSPDEVWNGTQACCS